MKPIIQLASISTKLKSLVSVKVHDENSKTRQSKAAVLPKRSKEDFLSLLGDTDDPKYPIYMIGDLEHRLNFLFVPSKTFVVTLFAVFPGPLLYTLCTAVIDLDEQTLSIVEGNPRKGEISHIFSLCSKDFKMP